MCRTFETLYNPGSTFSNLALHWNNSYCLTTMQALLVSFIVEVPYLLLHTLFLSLQSHTD